MCQCLNARHNLYTEDGGIGIDGFQLFLAVTAAHQSEIRIFRNFVGVFQIKIQNVHSGERHSLQIFPDKFGFINGVSGAVQHQPVFVQPYRFRAGKRTFGKMLEKQPDSAEKVCGVAVADHSGGTVPGDGESFFRVWFRQDTDPVPGQLVAFRIQQDLQSFLKGFLLCGQLKFHCKNAPFKKNCNSQLEV